MNLGQLISALRYEGDKLTSWYGAETNVESVSELIGSNEDGRFRVELKLNDVLTIKESKDIMHEIVELKTQLIKLRNIDEEKLDEIAEQEAIKHKNDGVNVYGHLNCDCQSFMEGYMAGYSAGYRAAKNEC